MLNRKFMLIPVLLAALICPISSNAEDVAVLVSASYATGDNIPTDRDFWYDMLNFYKTLVDAGYTHDNIHVFYGDGQDGMYDFDLEEWRPSSIPHYQNPYGTQITDYDNRKDTIGSFLSSLSLDGDDTLLLWWMGHGGPVNPSGPPPWEEFEFYAIVFNQSELDTIADHEFAGYIDHLTQTPKVFSIMTCFSGGVIDDIQSPLSIVMTSSDTYHISISMELCDTYHAAYHYYETCALHGRTPALICGPVYADFNGSGSISFAESFRYADSGTDWSPPQLSDLGDLAETTYLPGPVVSYISHSIDDDSEGASCGNGDSGMDAGETIELGVTVKNTGGSVISGAQGSLSIWDESEPYVTVTKATASFGDIPAHSEATTADDFIITIDNECPEGHYVVFEVVVDDNISHWSCCFDGDVGGLTLLALADPDVFMHDLRLPDQEENTLQIGDAEGYQASGGGSERISILTTTVCQNPETENAAYNYGGNSLNSTLIFFRGQIVEYDALTWEITNSFYVGELEIWSDLKYHGLAVDDGAGENVTYWCSYWCPATGSKKLNHYEQNNPTPTDEIDIPVPFRGLAFDRDNNHLWAIAVGSPCQLYEYDVSNQITLIQGPIEIAEVTASGNLGLEYDEENDCIIIVERNSREIFRYLDLDPSGSGGTPELYYLGGNFLPRSNMPSGVAIAKNAASMFAVNNERFRPRPMYCYEYPWANDTVLSGVIDQNTTIGGTIWITGDVVVQSGVTLTVDPGTQVFVLPMDMNNLWNDANRIEIVINGSLTVAGQFDGRVAFRSGAAEPDIGDWVGLIVQPSAQDVDIQYMDLAHAETGIFSFGTDVDINHSTIVSCVTGVSVRDAGGLLHDVEVSGCSGKGFYPHGQTGTASVVLDSCISTNNEYGFYFGFNAGSCEIRNKCKAIGNSEDGVHCRSSLTVGPEVWIENNGANGIHLIGVGAGGVIDGVTIVDHDDGSGILCLAMSSPEIKNCYIADNYDNITAKYYSLPVLGDISTSKGMNNSILDPTRYHVANYTTGTTIMAQMCYWGPCGGGQMPVVNLYGSVTIAPWLENQPNSPWTAPSFKPEAALENWVSQNYPNPFNPITRIDYQVAEPGNRVNLRIYDISGRLVRELVNGDKSSGRYTVEWNGRNQAGMPVATGVYLYRIQIGGEFVRTGKLVMMK